MAGWHHRLNGHEFEQAPGDSEGRMPGVMQSTGSHRVDHNFATEQQQNGHISLKISSQEIEGAEWPLCAQTHVTA